MSGQWQHSTNDRLQRLGYSVGDLWRTLAQPRQAQRLRRLLAALLLIWAVFSLSDLVWALLPGSDVPALEDRPVLNPVERPQAGVPADSVDIQAMAAWSLFGVAGTSDAAEIAAPVVEANKAREGIEDGARETRLDLKLRGAIASSDDGLGQAIIEHGSQQEVYAVGDTLPVGNSVSLAKVIVGAVVLDNNGNYEILRLFEGTTLLDQLPVAAVRQRGAPNGKIAAKPDSDSEPQSDDVRKVAQNFRRQLYEDPQSLAQVVRVSAVRENNLLKGYRVDPGKNGSQFKQLGFEPGDVITSVNGISLDNPGNAMQLYKIMRSVSEAVFDLERAGENMTISVSLSEVPNEG